MSEGLEEQELPSYKDASDNEPAPKADATATDASGLNVIFHKYDYVPKDLKPRLVRLGATLDKLLAMKSDNILGFGKIDQSMTTDLILFDQALQDYKRELRREKRKENGDNDDDDDHDMEVTTHSTKPKNKNTDIYFDDGGVLKDCTDDQDGVVLRQGDQVDQNLEEEKKLCAQKEPAIIDHGDKSVTCVRGHNQLIKVNFAYLEQIKDNGRLKLVPEEQRFLCSLCQHWTKVTDGCYNCPECRTFCYCAECYDLQLSPRTSVGGIKERMYQRARFRGDYSFGLWVTVFIIFYFGLLIGFGENIDSTCPESCDHQLSLEDSHFCTCPGNRNDICGLNSDGEKLSCVYEDWPEWQRIVLGVIPCVIYVINALYFIFSMDVSPVKAFFMPMLFIPAGLFAWVGGVVTLPMVQAIYNPVAIYQYAAKIYHKKHPRIRKKKRNSDKPIATKTSDGKDTDVKIDEDDYDNSMCSLYLELPSLDTLILSYNEEDHYYIFTEIELFGVAIKKGDWKLFIYWAIMFVLTYFILIIGCMKIYNPIDHYKCGDNPSECILVDSVGRCQDDCQIYNDIGDTCGVDSDGNEMICKLIQNDTVTIWQYTILGTFLGDILIVFAGLKWICHMKWAKAFCHAISLTTFLLLGWVPTGWFVALYFLINDVL